MIKQAELTKALQVLKPSTPEMVGAWIFCLSHVPPNGRV